jgi:hypothetical protein
MTLDCAQHEYRADRNGELGNRPFDPIRRYDVAFVFRRGCRRNEPDRERFTPSDGAIAINASIDRERAQPCAYVTALAQRPGRRDNRNEHVVHDVLPVLTGTEQPRRELD